MDKRRAQRRHWARWIIGVSIAVTPIVAYAAIALVSTNLERTPPEMTEPQAQATAIARDATRAYSDWLATATPPTATAEPPTPRSTLPPAATFRPQPSMPNASFVDACKTTWEYILYVAEGYEIDGFAPDPALEMAIAGVAATHGLAVSDLSACVITLRNAGYEVRELTLSNR